MKISRAAGVVGKLGVSIMVLLAWLPGVMAQSFSMIPPLPGGATTTANGLSGDGSRVVGDSITAGNVPEAYLFVVGTGTVQGLGVPAGLLDSRGRGVDVDAQGQVHVAGHGQYVSGKNQAFYRNVSTGTTVAIPILPGGDTATAVQLRCSATGEPFVVGNSNKTGAVTHGYRWKLSASTLDLGDPVTGTDGSNAFGVGFRPDGNFVVAGQGKIGWGGGNDKWGAVKYYSGDSTQYFQGFLDTVYKSSSQSMGKGISRNGQHMVGQSTHDVMICSSHRQAFLINADVGNGMQPVIMAGPNGIAETTKVGDDVQAQAVGASGLSPTTVVIRPGDNLALDTLALSGDDYIYRAGLGGLASNHASDALAVSNDGRYVVGWSRPLIDNGGGSCTWGAPTSTAMIWDAVNGMRDLKAVIEAETGQSLPDWVLTEAIAISDFGTTIAGNGTYDADGAGPGAPVARGWVAYLPGLNPISACCAVDGTCTEVPEGLCTGSSVFHTGQSCAEVSCPVLLGACCTPGEGTCSITTEAVCVAMGKNFAGQGTTCSVGTCPTPCGVPFADHDQDDDVDMDDFGAFQACFDMPLEGGCRCFNRDGNAVIDGMDFAEFDKCLTGPEVPWDQSMTPDCVAGTGLYP